MQDDIERQCRIARPRAVDGTLVIEWSCGCVRLSQGIAEQTEDVADSNSTNGENSITPKTDVQTDASKSFGAEDWFEIYQIISQYNDYLGSGQAEAYGSLYTVDGTFIGEGEGREAVVGRENLVEFIKQRWNKPESRKRTHWASNVVIRPTLEGAEAKSYQMMVDKGADGYRIGGIHKKVDVLRRENGKWRFHRRRSVSLDAK